MGVAKFTTSRIEDNDVPVIAKASCDPECGTRESIPISRDRKTQLPRKENIISNQGNFTNL